MKKWRGKIISTITHLKRTIGTLNPFKIKIYSSIFFLLLCSLFFITKNSIYNNFERELTIFQFDDENSNLDLKEGWKILKNPKDYKKVFVKGEKSIVKVFIKKNNTYYFQLRLWAKNKSESSYSEEVRVNGNPIITHKIPGGTDSWERSTVGFIVSAKKLRPGWNEFSFFHSISNPQIALEKIELLNHRGYSLGFFEAYILLDSAKYKLEVKKAHLFSLIKLISIILLYGLLFLLLFPIVMALSDYSIRIVRYYLLSVVAPLILFASLNLFSMISSYEIIFTERTLYNLLISSVVICHVIYISRHFTIYNFWRLFDHVDYAINYFAHIKILKKESVFIGTTLTILISVFFYRTIFFGEINSAAGILQHSPLFGFKNSNTNILWSDVLSQMEPWRLFSLRSLENGEFPLWNHLQSAGIPHFANMQSALLYPLNVFFSFFNMKIAGFLFYFMKLFLTGIFTYFYLKELDFHRYSSMIGAIAFAFCGYNICWLYWPVSSVTFFLPASLFLFERVFKANNWESIIKLFMVYSLLFVAALFGGHPETLFHIVFFTTSYFIFLLFSLNLEWKKRIIMFSFFVGFNFLGTLLSMVQLLPFLEYLSISEVFLSRSVEMGSGKGSVFFAFITNIIPDFYGNQTFGNIVPYYASPTNYNELGGGYIGLFMLVLAFVGVKYFTKDRKMGFLLIMLLIFCSVAYRISPISNIFEGLPLFKIATNIRMQFLIGFILVVLGCKTFDGYYFKNEELKGSELIKAFAFIALIVAYCWFLTWKSFLLIPDYGVDRDYLEITRTQIITVLVWLLTFICVRWLILNGKKHRYKNVILVMIPLFIFLETGIHGIFYVPTVKNKNFYPENHLINKIKSENSGHYRSTAIGVFSPPNVNVAYNISDIRNYDAINILKYKEFINYMFDSKREDFLEINDVNSTLLNLMGVKYIITDSQEMQENYKLVMENSEKNIFLFANSTVFKRAYIAKKYTVIKNDLIILESIKNKKLDLSKEVILEEYPPANFSNPLNNEDHAAQTTITTYKSNLVRIKTNSEKQGFLVLSDNYFPGWKAFIDGERTKIYRANYTFRAVHIPGGSHEVTFKYDPLSFKIGLYITIFSLLLLSAVFAYVTLKGKKEEKIISYKKMD